MSFIKLREGLAPLFLDAFPGPVAAFPRPLCQHFLVVAILPQLDALELDTTCLLARFPELALAKQAGLYFPIVHFSVALAVCSHVVVVGQESSAVQDVALFFEILFHGFNPSLFSRLW